MMDIRRRREDRAPMKVIAVGERGRAGPVMAMVLSGGADRRNDGPHVTDGVGRRGEGPGGLAD